MLGVVMCYFLSSDGERTWRQAVFQVGYGVLC